jgi:DivIVA domain-containing protein
MMWFFAVLIVLVIGGVVVVATGAGDPLSPSYDDRPDVVLPSDRPLTAEDLMSVRFTSVVRGYRASEVDELLARLANQLYREQRAPLEPPTAPSDPAPTSMPALPTMPALPPETGTGD